MLVLPETGENTRFLGVESTYLNSVHAHDNLQQLRQAHVQLTSIVAMKLRSTSFDKCVAL